MNTPRDGRVKSCFRARKGHVFVHIDAGGLELSTIAQVWADLGLGDTLAKDIRAGVDRHSTVAAALLGTTYEDVRARIKAKDPLAKNGRQTGKVANFGIPGGLGSDRFRVFARAQYGVELTPDESAHVISLWKKLNPEAKNYFALIDRAVSSLGYVEQVRSGRVRGGVSYTEACNTMFQGLGADVMMDWGWRVTRECYTGNGALFGSRVVIFEHDCLIVESPDALAPYAAERIRELMEQAAQYWLPDVPLTGEPALARYWEKDPRPVRGPDGLLLVPPC
jgi:DNA polymerase-1